MKYMPIILLSILIQGCHSVKIQGNRYDVSLSATELGAVGTTSIDILFCNRFSQYSVPVLKNKIRLEARIVKFDKHTYREFKLKNASNPLIKKVNDSIAIKKDYVIFKILDKQTLLGEYNSDYNKSLVSYLKSSGKGKVVTSVAVYLDEKELEKLKKADSFYLVNQFDHKYVVQLFKDGKKNDVIDLQPGTPLAYITEGFCWDTDKRGEWLPADLDADGCHGKLQKKIKSKKQTSLYNM
jgi:glycerophosphoryl diester phosphodiesterase